MITTEDSQPSLFPYVVGLLHCSAVTMGVNMPEIIAEQPIMTYRTSVEYLAIVLESPRLGIVVE